MNAGFKIAICMVVLLQPGETAFSQNLENFGAGIIKQEELIQTVGFLSSSRFHGRLPGSMEYEQAARYVATRFKNAGIKPVGQPSMLQYFNDEVNLIHDASCFILNSNGRPIIPLTLGEDFVCRGFTGSGHEKGEAVFAGFGMKHPNYDDYRNINVKGKIVVAFKSAPPWASETGSWGDTSPRAKARTAKEQGAAGIIFIADPKVFPPTMIYGSIACGDGPHLFDFPMIQLSDRATDSLFAELPVKAPNLYEQICQDKAPHSIELGRSVLVNVKAEYFAEKPTANVVGIVEGSDSLLKNEYVVLGAHLDHVGYQGEKLYFPGANDNASGVAAIIAIAEALKKSKVEIKRSIIFIAFSSEESGLRGSKYFVDHSPVDLSEVVAMLNFDCVGQGDSIAIGGRLSFPKLWKKVKKIDKHTTKLLSTRTFGGGGADAEAFYRAGISTLYFNTTNGYKHLHSPSDRAETINPELIEKVAKLGYLVTVDLANGRFKGERDRQRKK